MQNLRSRQQQIILADDRPVIIAGVRGYIDRCPDLSVAATATTSDQILARLKDTPCDILITEFSIAIENMNDGFTLLSYVRRHYPKLCLIVLTLNNMPAVMYQIIKCGVNAALHMNDELVTIREAIDSAESNTRYIGKTVRNILRSGPVGIMPTKRETEVLRMYAEGQSMQEIATRLHKSVKTIALQKMSAMRKVGLRNDVELGRYTRGHVRPDEKNFPTSKY
ncbi:response regulator transcription factor [Glaciimonas immobilis]|uniref:Two-component system capsular synthesis response regulator RcsB n=1 Tax=Glaciimonas immobilis TaxID=728004 RepID=A0A840RS78_9BURK|nr:response regulator transcription factor [Glaciimonas immobilis]KAF3996982.1 response regulator transcription factor [Glaciimonas immobilis]MBB5199816.1 two-component system capsular synthesis response regulator RcsB [Glaciimonas immobilis]